MRATRKRMTKKQRRGRKSKRTMRKRVQRVRKMHGGDVLHKLPDDNNYLTYYGKVVDMSGNEISDRNFLEIDEGSWEIINTKLQEHAHETFTGADEIIEVGYGGDNGNGTITVKIPEGASNAPGSSVALHVVTKPLGPMIFDIGGQTYRMKFTVNFGN